MTVLIYKSFFVKDIPWVDFFCNGTYVLSAIATLFTIYSFIYLNFKANNNKSENKLKWKTNLT
ncbi:hypothetical protein [Elizabethkingia sp. JS20170427COW]|uniref:hypothetical protein n=1 Tax=Elizabethkingia sp. JS20170427COW TaxID=2583851 RepID=UPI0021021E20|nr:hypothetical protein [Elizabethkingia sp. JS20170427COW]